MNSENTNLQNSISQTPGVDDFEKIQVTNDIVSSEKLISKEELTSKEEIFKDLVLPEDQEELPIFKFWRELLDNEFNMYHSSQWNKNLENNLLNYTSNGRILFMWVNNNELNTCIDELPNLSKLIEDSLIQVFFVFKTRTDLVIDESNAPEVIGYKCVSITKGVFNLIDEISQNLIPLLIKDKTWPENIRKEIFGFTYKFLCNLTEIKSVKEKRVNLFIPTEPIGIYLENWNPSSQEHKDICNRLEIILAHWIKQIKDILTNQSNQTENDNGDLIEEVMFWSKCKENLVYLRSQLKDTRISQLLEILSMGNSNYIATFNTLSESIVKGASQAENNLKYLRILEQPCIQIENLTTLMIPTMYQSVFFGIRLIWEKCSYYNSEEKIAGLFKKVSNQIIKKCSASIELDQLFAGNVETCIQALDSSISCLKEWRDVYDRNVNLLKKKKCWSFESDAIFAQIEAFVQRCLDLKEICEGQIQFARKGANQEMPIFDGSKSNEIYGLLDEIKDNFEKQLHKLSGTNIEKVLDIKSSKWHEEYNVFKSGIKNLDNMYINLITLAFDNVHKVEQAIEFFIGFRNLAKRDPIILHLYKKIDKINELLIKDIQNTEYLSKTTPNPSLYNGNLSGKVTWNIGLLQRIQNIKSQYDKLYFIDYSYKEQVELEYQRLENSIKKFITNTVKDFKESSKELEATLIKRLDQNIIVEEEIKGKSKTNEKAISSKKNYIESNFDKLILSYGLELTGFKRAGGLASLGSMGKIEEFLETQKDKLKIYRENVMLVVRDYNTVIKLLNPFQEDLFTEHMENINTSIFRGLKILRWSSQGTLDNFVKECRSKCDNLLQKINNFNNLESQIRYIIQKNFSIIKILFFDSRKILEFEQFKEQQKICWTKSIQVFENMTKEIVEQLNDIYLNFIDKGENVQKTWFGFIDQIDKLIESEIRKIYKNNFSELLKAISGDEKSKTNPAQIVRIYIILNNENKETDLNFEPTIEELNSTIEQILHKSIDIFVSIPRLHQTMFKQRDKMISDIVLQMQEDVKNTRGGNNAKKNQMTFIEIKEDIIDKYEKNYKKVIKEEVYYFQVEIIKQFKIQSTKLSNQLEPWKKNCFMLTESNEYGDYTNFIIGKTTSIANLRSAVEYYDIIQTEIQIEKSSDDSLCVQVDSNKIKKKLIDINYEEQKLLLSKIKEKGMEELQKIEDLFFANEKKLQTNPSDLYSLKESIDLWQSLYDRKEMIASSLTPLEEKFRLLDDYMIVFQDSEIKIRQGIKENFENFYNKLDEIKRRNDSYYDQYQNDHLKKLQDFEQEVREIKLKIQKEMPIKKDNEMSNDKAFALISLFNGFLKEIKDSEQKMLFGFDLFKIYYVPVPEIQQIEQDIDNLVIFWNLHQEWTDKTNSFLFIQFFEINTEMINGYCDETKSRIHGLPKVVQTYEICHELINEINKFIRIMTLIELLKVDFLRERHWKTIQENVKENFDLESKQFNLQKIFELNFENISDVIRDINEAAHSEFKIEELLRDIKRRWDKEEMVFETLKFTNINILSGVYGEKLVEYLEEDLIQLSSLKSNPFAIAFLREIENWDTELNRISEILDLLITIQKKFVYFNNIFSNLSEEIGQLIGDKNIFNNVKINLMGYLSRFEIEKNTRKNLLTRNLKETLSELLVQLETIQRHMKKYLEKRKFESPRFYFLSDEDIFEILGKAKDPLCLKKFLKKIFEGIAELEYLGNVSLKGKMNDYTAFISSDKERMEFLNKIEINGDLNFMIHSIEREMKEKLKSCIFESCHSFNVVSVSSSKSIEKLEKWLNETAGSISLICSEVDWTAKCYQGLLNNSLDEKPSKQQKKVAMTKDIWSVIKNQASKYLNDLISIIRKSGNELLKKKVITLITVEVHHKDLYEVLSSCNSNSFEWSSQLRFYKHDESGEKSNLSIEQNAAKFEYGYEYQGNNGRLVITPLTDRCYLTLTNAMHFKRGGNPQGPAGTGKTETVKDLGKCMGRFVFVFNCSEGLDANNMKNMFEGFAQTGFWGCFDEFNRIEIDVLSVVAIQINTILEAISAEKKVFDFEEKEIPLNFNCALFITMNPGYLGRSELPDNLKALFRPISMIVPDSVQICRIALQAEGFKNADFLSKKIEILYNLMRQTLSRQEHYDFGLRAMKTVFSMAGEIRRNYNFEDPMNKKEPENFLEQKIFLQAIYNSNEPKLISTDIQIFENLLTDLFPEREVNSHGNESNDFIMAIDHVMNIMNLDKIDYFVDKVSQISNTKNSRHGNIIIGNSMSGKTTLLNVLEGVQNKMGNKTRSYVLNPKTLTVSELYGLYNESTDDNILGVFSSIMDQLCNKDETSDEKWIVFDGPIDTRWIENMNSLLDDNKVLTLLDGNRINLKYNVKLFFEVDEVSKASPATISRCGVIFIDSKELSPNSIRTAWVLFKDSQNYKEYVLDYFDYLFDKWAEPLLIKKRGYSSHEVVCISENTQIKNLCNLFESFIDKIGSDFSKIPLKDFEEVYPNLERIFVFCVIWSFGVTLNETGKQLFDNNLRDIESILPFAHTIFDYYPSIEKKRFLMWEEKLTIQPNQWKPSHNTNISDYLVETVDTARIRFIVNTLLENRQNVLGIGASGVGKTITFKTILNNMDDLVFTTSKISLTAGTTSARLQENIESKLNRTTKKKLRPFSGRKGVFFIDDLALPKKDSFGYQPTLELLRQILEQNGMYDRNLLNIFVQIKDLQFITAIREGETIPNRLLNKFNVIAIGQPADSQLRRIYNSILYYNFSDFDADEVKSEIEKCVNYLITTFKAIASSEDLISSPSKPHYLFSLKDISRIIKGVSIIPKANCDSKSIFLKLFYHEQQRVYQDKMILKSDSVIMKQILDNSFNSEFETKITELLGESLESPIFSSVLYEETGYQIISDRENESSIDQLKKVFEECLQQYNQEKKIGLNIVLFSEAIIQAIKISRGIIIEEGNLLLIGDGGTGRTSLTKLSAFVTKTTVYEIKTKNVAAFRTQIKQIFETIVFKPSSFILLIKENDVKNQDVMEEINSLLSSGEIPNLFAKKEGKDEFLKIRDKFRNDGHKESDENLYDNFVKFIKSKMHIVFCIARLGDNLRLITRNYSGIVYGTSQIVFDTWNKTALVQIAKWILKPLESNIENSIFQKLPEYFANTHYEINKVAIKMNLKCNQNINLTPKTFIDFGKCFNNILFKKNDEISRNISKYENGLNKLAETRDSVEQLKQSMDIKRVELHKKKKECEEMLFKIDNEKRESAKEKKNIEEKEEFLTNDRKETMEMAAAAEQQLLRAMPALNEANEKVQTLDNNSMAEIKVLLKTKDKRLELIMFSLMILLNEKPKWDNVQKVATATNFVSRIHDIDKEKIDEEKVRKLEQYTQQPEMQTNLENFSRAVNTLAVFIRAIELYSKINIDVTPIKLTVKKLKSDLAMKEEELIRLKQNLINALQRLEDLNLSYDNLNKEYILFLKEFSELEQRLERAEKLVSGLMSSQENWISHLKYYNEFKEKLLGNVLIASSFLNYFGPFNYEFRNEISLNVVMPQLKSLKAPFHQDLKVVEFLNSEVELLDWYFNGLPNDQTSLENAVIARQTFNVPYIIDPQLQCINWLKNLESKSQTMFIDTITPKTYQTLEKCIMTGVKIVFENNEDEIPDVFEFVLTNNTKTLSGGKVILLFNDKEILLHPNFKLYIITKNAKTNMKAEIASLLTIVNFTVVPVGLEDQLLNYTVKVLDEKMENQRIESIKTKGKCDILLRELEDKILDMLQADKETPLVDSIELIDTLHISKEKEEEVQNTLESNKVNYKKIMTARENYRYLGFVSSKLYFIISYLTKINQVYQFSLTKFLYIFEKTLIKIRENKNDFSNTINEKIKKIDLTFRRKIYNYCVQSMFEKDHIILSLLLAINFAQIDAKFASIMKNDDPKKKYQLEKNESKENLDMDTNATKYFEEEFPNELKFFLQQSYIINSEGIEPNPDPSWISSLIWDSMIHINNLPRFQGILGSFMHNTKEWKKYYISSMPEKEPLPSDWSNKIKGFSLVLFIKILRPDRLFAAIEDFVKSNIGSDFIKSKPFNLEKQIKKIDKEGKNIPILILVSSNVDPWIYIEQLAQKNNRMVSQLSLGQGQLERAKGKISKAIQEGFWVFLGNIHLSISFLKDYEMINNLLNSSKKHPNFQLFLSSKAIPEISLTLLLNSNRMILEPLKGIKPNLSKIVANLIPIFRPFEDRDAILEFVYYRKLIFVLAWFHTTISERKKFRSLGWNSTYEFPDTDFVFSEKMIHDFVVNGQKNGDSGFQWDSLKFIIGQINYGGRITDNNDQKLLIELVNNIFIPEIFATKGFVLAKGNSGLFKVPSDLDDSIAILKTKNAASINSLFNTLSNGLLDYIKSLPDEESPEIYGQHINAEITMKTEDSNRIVDIISNIQSNNIDSNKNDEEKEVIRLFENLIEKIPKYINITSDSKRTLQSNLEEADNRADPFRTFFTQEANKYNQILKIITSDFNVIVSCLTGKLIASEEIEELINSISQFKLPTKWRSFYLSNKSLIPWIADLNERVAQVSTWFLKETLSKYWIGGFIYPNGFLTSLLQSYSRKFSIAIDNIKYEYIFLSSDCNLGIAPKEGAYITGLYLEGAKWNQNEGLMSDCEQMNLYSPISAIHIRPVEKNSKSFNRNPTYNCPCYIYPNRDGTVEKPSFVTNISVPFSSKMEVDESFWIKRGTAILLSLN